MALLNSQIKEPCIPIPNMLTELQLNSKIGKEKCVPKINVIDDTVEQPDRKRSMSFQTEYGNDNDAIDGTDELSNKSSMHSRTECDIDQAAQKTKIVEGSGAVSENNLIGNDSSQEGIKRKDLGKGSSEGTMVKLSHQAQEHHKEQGNMENSKYASKSDDKDISKKYTDLNDVPDKDFDPSDDCNDNDNYDSTNVASSSGESDKFCVSEKGEFKTLLMRACEKANKEIVENLLQHEVNVNVMTGRTRNTALHFACMDEMKLMFNSIDKERIANRIEIVGMLLEHGAVYKPNALGMTPMYLAGKYRMLDLVNYLGRHRVVLKAAGTGEMIRGHEFVGLSWVIHQPRNPYMAWKHLTLSKDMQGEDMILASSYAIPELLDCFGRKEIDSPIALANMQSDYRGIEFEGYLIAARVYPKENYPWVDLILCALQREYSKYPHSKKLLWLAVRRVVEDQKHVHLLLTKLTEIIDAAVSYICPCNLNHFMEALLSSLKEADGTWLRPQALELGKKLGKILCHFGVNGCTFTEQLFCTVEKLVAYLQEANRVHRGNQRTHSLGCAWNIIHDLVIEKRELSLAVFLSTTQMFFKLILSLLRLEGALHVEKDQTMLHLLSYAFIGYIPDVDNVQDDDDDEDDHPDWLYTGRTNYTDFIHALTVNVILFGCPFDAENGFGLTAIEQFAVNQDFMDRDITALEPHEMIMMRLLHGPLSVLSLEKLSAMSILKWRIPYRSVLPKLLWNIIEKLHDPKNLFDISE